MNEYVYVGNNPVNRVDPDGDNWKKWAAYGLIGFGVALSFTGVGGLFGAMAIGAASNALIDGGAAYNRGARGTALRNTIFKSAALGAASAAIGWGVGRAATKIASKLADKEIHLFNHQVRIERHPLVTKRNMGFSGPINTGHINIGDQWHIVKPSTAKILRGSRLKFIYKTAKK